MIKFVYQNNPRGTGDAVLKTRNLIKEVPDNIFTVSCNLSFPNSHLIFAQDEPIIDKIVKEHTKGFNTQIIFTLLRAYEKYADSGRLLLIDEDKLFPRTQGLSTGILAIGTLLNPSLNR